MLDLQLFTDRYQTHDPADGLAVRTTLGMPRFALRYPLVGHVPHIAPSRDIFRINSRDRFRSLYRARLDSFGRVQIQTALEEVAFRGGDTRLVLLCFDDVSKDWCHRQFFAEWWLDQTGDPVVELQPKVRGTIPGQTPVTVPAAPEPEPGLF